MKFRKDINGLRAIAVIAVMLFHFDKNWMPGGFAGVDVFFVISGFLMTGIIFRGIEQENFSIWKFYIARANRIIPALAFLCLVLVVFGWFYLLPLDFLNLGKHIGGSMAFLSNIMYWGESGYFAAASQEKWLLHTWSLSVEWQFYIIYPLVLVALKKFMSLNIIKVTILIGTVLSFILCVSITYQSPTIAYFSLPTRAWELLMGGVAYLYPFSLSASKKKLFEWVGVILIVLSFIFISKNNYWPGFLALASVVGTLLVIQSHRNDSIVTGNLLFQQLGKWSYSIYLWHWPLFVLFSYYSLGKPVYLIPLSVALGFLSYSMIEHKALRFNTTVIKPISLCLVLGFVSILVWNGFNRYQFENNSFFSTNSDIRSDWLRRKSNSEIKDVDVYIKNAEDSQETILWLGDSLIQQYRILIKERPIENKMIFLLESGCFPIRGFKYRGGRDCHLFEWLGKIINDVHISKVVVTGNLDFYMSRKDNFVELDSGSIIPLNTNEGRKAIRN